MTATFTVTNKNNQVVEVCCYAAGLTFIFDHTGCTICGCALAAELADDAEALAEWALLASIGESKKFILASEDS